MAVGSRIDLGRRLWGVLGNSKIECCVAGSNSLNGTRLVKEYRAGRRDSKGYEFYWSHKSIQPSILKSISDWRL